MSIPHRIVELDFFLFSIFYLFFSFSLIITTGAKILINCPANLEGRTKATNEIADCHDDLENLDKKLHAC